MSCICLIGCKNGTVGKHINTVLRKADGGERDVRYLSRSSSNEWKGDASSPLPPGFLDGCTRACVILPQSFTSEEMEVHGKRIGEELVSAGVTEVVRLSSYNIGAEPSQGPLGMAHERIEAYYVQKGLLVVSVRPTSFFSNFQFSVESIVKDGVMRSPLGTAPHSRVNWVSPEDIGGVLAKLLLEPDLRGKTRQGGPLLIVNVEGGVENTFSAQEQAAAISGLGLEYLPNGGEVRYEEATPPMSSDYSELWGFLQKGGFSAEGGGETVREFLGRQPKLFVDYARDTLMAYIQNETKRNT